MRFVGLALILATAVASCKTTKANISSAVESASTGAGELPMCYGYRGNGTNIFATTGGVARLYDQFGDPAAISGTSSGSIVAFLNESLAVPNAVYTCASCSREQANERRSFVLKAFPLWVKALMASDGMAKDITKIKDAEKIFQTILSLSPAVTAHPPMAANPPPAASSSSAGGKSLSTQVLTSPIVEGIISQAVLLNLRTMSVELKNLISPEYYKISGYDGGKEDDRLAVKAIANILAFQGIGSADGFQRENLMYPGVVNFQYVFEAMGVIADWYAGYGSEYPKAALSALLDQCATNTRGQWWNPIAAKSYGQSTCGQEYYKLFAAYFNARKVSNDPHRRLNEQMGLYLPAFVSTSAIAGNEVVATMNQSADSQTWSVIDDLKLDRKNFAVLYFGPAQYQQTLNDKKSMFHDVVTQNIVSMDPVTWNVGMRASAQEPAVARAVTYHQGDQNYLATGGYVDQIQSKMLKMIGCQKTIVVNSNTPILGFSNKYAPKTWDQFPTLVSEIFDAASPTSSESIAFEQTSALLCSRWESYKLLETWEMADSSYFNAVFTEDPSLLKDQAAFTLLNGTQTTTKAPPKQCYSVPRIRQNQYPAYALPQ